MRSGKQCGAKLSAVRTAVEKPDSAEGFDWSKTWVADMLLSNEEKLERKAKRLSVKSSEVRRRNEIKAGTITASCGVGVMITVFFVMQGIILGRFVPPEVAEILARVWVAGAIPMLVGLALIFNGLFVSRREKREVPSEKTSELAEGSAANYLSPADTNEFDRVPFSVTDTTTKHLKEPRK